MPDSHIIDNCEVCNVQCKYFKCLTKPELQLVNENRYEAAFKPGEIILKQGSPASNALFMAEGKAKVYMESENGRNFIMGIIKPGRLVIGPGAYVKFRHTYSVAALTIVHACFISFDIFRQLVRSNSEFAEIMINDISEKALGSHLRTVSLTQKKMPGRVAEALLYFAEEVFGSDRFEMILSRKELGEFTNMTRESVVRILKGMEDSGVISSEGSVVCIEDREKLKMISEKG
ncbi:MAG: Crp/Fnr family transcriptional regulator [Bacteroidales bacterium]